MVATDYKVFIDREENCFTLTVEFSNKRHAAECLSIVANNDLIQREKKLR